MNIQPNQDIIQNRLNRIRQSQTTTTQHPLSNSPNIPHQKQANITISSSPSLPTSSNNITTFNSPDTTKTFQQTLQKELTSKATIPKEKFGTFVQQANEMFQNYEKEINILRKRTSFFNYQELSYNYTSFNIEPSKKDKILHELNIFTEKEKHSLNEIKIAYTERICELLTENATLTQMLEKMNTGVVGRLQEKISDLIKELKTVELDNSNLRRKLDNMNSVFDQNQILKEDITIKSKEINRLRGIKDSNENTIKNLTKQINELNMNIEEHKSTIETKEKINEQNIIQINSLNNTIEQHNNTINQKNEIIKKKEDEITLLFNDNVKWEERYTLASKEIDNYKKWSLWDMNLIDSYKKIEELENKVNDISQDNETLKNEIITLDQQHTMKSNQIETLKTKINSLESDNYNLTQIKSEYERNKHKVDNYDNVFTENKSLKYELETIHDRHTKQIDSTKETYEKTIKDQKLKYESEISEQKIDYELKLEKGEKEKQTLNEEHENKIKTLEDEIKKHKNEISELNEQIEKKVKALTNYKEAFDNIMVKLKEQEKQLSSKQTSYQESPSLLLNNETSNQQVEQSNNSNTSSSSHKTFSTFDKYAFTKEIMIDYFYCLFLFEASIHYQLLMGNMVGNFDNYLNNIFLSNHHSYHLNTSLQSECIQDLCFIAVRKLLLSKKIKEANEINFEIFDREVLKEISDCFKTKNFISKLNPVKTVDKLSVLFLRKYTKHFDFEGNLNEFLTNNVLPSIENRLEKRARSINEDTSKLIDMTISSIQNGQIYVNNKPIYSFDKFIQQINHIKLNEGSLMITNKIICYDHIIHILKYEKITDLTFRDNSLSEGDLTFICDMILLYVPKLKSLKIITNNLYGDIFSNKFISTLKLLKDLNYLDLTDNKIGDDDIKPFSEFLKTNKSIQTLLLDLNKMTSRSGFFLADALNKNHSIQSLSVNHNEITGSGLESLLNVISNNTQGLVHLNLADNKLQKDDFNQIATFFNANPSLQILDLSNNAINPLCSNVLGVNLKKAKYLKCLKLNNTKMNEESGPQFLSFIHETNVEELELDMNIFGESGLFMIMNKIKNASNIKKISLKRCGMTPVFLNIIAQNIIGNKNLEIVNLEGNDFEGSVFIKFCEDIKDKTNTKVIFTKDLLLENIKDITNDNILLV